MEFLRINVTRTGQQPYGENSDGPGGADGWKSLGTGGFDNITMLSLPKLIYKCNAIPIKIMWVFLRLKTVLLLSLYDSMVTVAMH